MNFNVLFAIFRRNFISYFSNPTGYVFICVFVLLSSLAAFWPNAFFNNNLANLDQLNRWLPYIMLVFIPAITMSVWAEERRLGTDELLLTIPAGDLEVVLGKFTAAVAIFSCSLAFSGLSNFAVLRWLGIPDTGLFFGNYFGYWMVGVTMLSIGMVASFLTSNVTVGFILGAVFNAPLVFAGAADVILPTAAASPVSRWSIEFAFRDYGRGVISLSALCYFVCITAVMVYLSVVLIGRRHWWGGRDGHAMLGHYLARAFSLVMVAVCLTIFFLRYDVRADVTEEQLTALSPKTKNLLRELNPKHQVLVEAFISPEVPDAYVQRRLDLLNMLREIDSRGGSDVEVRIHHTEQFSEQARLAEEQYEITAREVFARVGGADTRQSIYLGLVVQAGLDKVILPFIDPGIPLEYELVRSIATVGRRDDDRKKLGLLTTDANLSASGNDDGMIDELRKQYEVDTVDPSSPITQRYDVVLAVQPSSLAPPAMDNFIDMVRSGQPTCIFEDPMPMFDPQVPGTNEPKRPPGGMFGMQGGPPQPKGDIGKLWRMLGVEFGGDDVVYHKYNPYPQYDFPPELVWCGRESGASEPFQREDQITSGLQLTVFPFPGWISRARRSTGLSYKPLVFTSDQSGVISRARLFSFDFQGRRELDPNRPYEGPKKEYAMAAHIRGKLTAEPFMHPGHTDEEGHGKEKAAPATREINVVVVADMDCLNRQIFAIRARGSDPTAGGTDFEMDNVAFVLNALDDLAGDDRFIDIRKRRRVHRTLTKVEQASKEARDDAAEKRKDFQRKFEQSKKDAEERLTKESARIAKMEGLSKIQMAQMMEFALRDERQKLQAEVDQLEDDRDRATQLIDRNLQQEIRSVQHNYKIGAVVLPPIVPLLIGLVVFFNRRAREREGVPQARLRRLGTQTSKA